MERRWIILASDGRHVTVGRATEPTDEELSRAADGLRGLGLGGWLAEMHGSYYSRRAVTLVISRTLAEAGVSFDAACEAFQAHRKGAVPC